MNTIKIFISCNENIQIFTRASHSWKYWCFHFTRWQYLWYSQQKNKYPLYLLCLENIAVHYLDIFVLFCCCYCCLFFSFLFLFLVFVFILLLLLLLLLLCFAWCYVRNMFSKPKQSIFLYTTIKYECKKVIQYWYAKGYLRDHVKAVIENRNAG